jgi:hypothetical protein
VPPIWHEHGGSHILGSVAQVTQQLAFVVVVVVVTGEEGAPGLATGFRLSDRTSLLLKEIVQFTLTFSTMRRRMHVLSLINVSDERFLSRF